MLPEFELLIPQTLEEAISILSEKGKDCTVVAGGTDVYVDMHGKYKSAPYLMDIKHLEDLKVFSFVPGQGLSIGALTHIIFWTAPLSSGNTIPHCSREPARWGLSRSATGAPSAATSATPCLPVTPWDRCWS